MKKLFVLMFFITLEIIAQPNDRLMVWPHHLHFNSDFERSQVVHIENNTTNSVVIDSLTYNPNVYFIRLNSTMSFPIVLESKTNILIEVIQYNYFNLQLNDSTSNIYIHNSSTEPTIGIETHHHQEIHEINKGQISGVVSSGTNLLAGATIYFFYNQNLLVDSAKTDNNGYYLKELPRGNYFALAKMDGYYMSYAFNKDSPLEADVLSVQSMTPIIVDFDLEQESITDNDISGNILDNLNSSLSKSIVIIRKGGHTPTKIVADSTYELNQSYTTITDKNGFYKLQNIKQAGEYYVQAFAPFNIPGYFNHNKSSSVFWQKADSIVISNSVDNIDVILDRDSSYGAGLVEGSVLVNSENTPITDALVFVRSVDTKKIYTYNFTGSDGSFSIPVLPYGEYELVTNKFGVNDGISSKFIIDSAQDSISGIEVRLTITSVSDFFLPSSFELHQNYPNPFNPTTTITYQLTEFSLVTLKVYDVLGKEIAILVDKPQSAGSYQVSVNIPELSSGVYFYKLSNGVSTKVKKMTFIK